MRTRLHAENPFGPTRFGFAWEQVPEGCPALLDFGCYTGKFLASVGGKHVGRVVGVDVSREAVQGARRRCPGTDVRHLSATVPLPFGDGEFDTVLLLDVIEHVHEQTALVDEVARVLSDDGRLIVTVPRQYAFSFCDVGNLKFRFPRLHRWLFLRAHPREEYERRYVSNPDGLIGDVSAEKRWHEHFTEAGLRNLLGRSGLEVVTVDGSGYWARPLSLPLYAMERFPGIRRFARWIRDLDARWFASMNLFCVAVKRGRGVSAGTGLDERSTP